MTNVFAPQYVGDKVSGTLTKVCETTSRFTREPIPILYLSGDGGEIEVRAFHVGLRRHLRNALPSLGQHVTVTYIGKKPIDRSTYLHDYEVTATS
ncbi:MULTISPECIES: hypothetical protein [unclassified Pseudonocardia]|uniref:hypothetical protein n=1 Tax=unclassified Pseudonocardia TaxID=2619320 RepID=UPI00049236F6|nr:hypothetical protein [Pseudonocardia sp. Ae707_Ps1]OLM17926.1 hypothetical protein Ae707Ps1_2185c [Pseudonocardia sp. Ae707_Ps1]